MCHVSSVYIVLLLFYTIDTRTSDVSWDTSQPSIYIYIYGPIPDMHEGVSGEYMGSSGGNKYDDEREAMGVR